MKILIYFLALISFVLNINSLDYNYRTKEKVKKIEVRYIQPSYIKGKLSFEKVERIFSVEFYKDGKIKNEIEKNSNGEVVVDKKYVYIKDEESIKKLCGKGKKDDEEWINKVCDGKKYKILEVKLEYSGNIEGPFKTYFYVSSKNNGIMDRLFVFDMDYLLLEYYEYKYSKDNQPVEEKKYDSAQELVEIKKIKTTRFYKLESFYDKYEVLKKTYKEEYTSEKTLRRTVTTYYTYSGDVKEKVVVNYSKVGLKLKEEEYTGKNMAGYYYIFKYDFDKYMNWKTEYKYKVNRLNNRKRLDYIIIRNIYY